MKKLTAITTGAAISFLLTACSINMEDATNSIQNPNIYKIGMASYTSTQDTYGYTQDLNAQSNVSTSYVTCIVSDDGIIEHVEIDEVQTTLNFDGEGQLLDYMQYEVPSKKELAFNYGMKDYSSIGKEWHEQIDALEKYMVGKDINIFIAEANLRNRSVYSMYDENYVNDYYTDYGYLQENYGIGSNTNNYYMQNENTSYYRNKTKENFDSYDYGQSSTDSAPPTDEASLIEMQTSKDTQNSNITSITENSMPYEEDLNSSDALENSMTENETNSNTENNTDDEMGSWKTDLQASVTINTDNIMYALLKAYENAR